jgi:tetratricopeptide (TPR) repeat protein
LSHGLWNWRGIEQRVTDDRSDAYTWFQEGLRLLASADVHAAAIALEQARAIEPEQGSIREALARAYFRCGRYPAAASEFDQAVQLDPVNDYAHFGLGLSLLRVGERDRARGHLKLAVAMRPLDEYREALAQVGDDG